MAHTNNSDRCDCCGAALTTREQRKSGVCAACQAAANEDAGECQRCNNSPAPKPGVRCDGPLCADCWALETAQAAWVAGDAERSQAAEDWWAAQKDGLGGVSDWAAWAADWEAGK